MNPTRYLSRIAALLTAFIVNVVIFSASAQASENPRAITSNSGAGELVLEDLVVQRDAKLTDVRYEADDTLSLLTNNQFATFKAINSGPGAAVNFDIFFARRSVVMTADGYDTLEQMALALVYMEDGAGLELQVYMEDDSSKILTERRVNEVLALLQGRYGVNVNIGVTYVRQDKRFSKQKSGAKAPDLFPLTLINLGSIASSN